MSVLGRLHLITDARPERDPLAVVRATLRAGSDAGATCVVQVRVDDSATDREAYDLARRVVELCRPAGAACLVNDRLHVALAVGADGGHVGADDLPVPVARRVLGNGAVLGATARSPEDGATHVSAGADYLGVGPAYRSPTKHELPEPLGPAGVAAVASAVDVPVVAIGGVTAARVQELVAAGAYGVAVVSAVSEAAEPYTAARDLFDALARATAAQSSATAAQSSATATPLVADDTRTRP